MSQKIKTSVEIDGSLTANSIVKSGGTASQILAADGSVVTAGSGVTISGGTISASGSAGVLSFNTRTGAVTLTSGDVTTALGYTPYNASNPAGYISSYTETDTLATVTGRGATTGTSITVGGVFTTKGTNPYIQWQNSAGNRLGYIQHSTNLVMSSDTGNIEFTPNTGIVKMLGHIRYGGASAYSSTGLDSNGFYQDVNGTNIYESTMRLQSNILSGVSSYNGLKFGAAAIGNASEGFTIFTGGYDNNRLTINASGNVSIGVTPSSYKFHVAGGQYGTYLKGGDLGTGSDILRLVDASNNTKYLARGDGKHFFTGDTDVSGNLTASGITRLGGSGYKTYIEGGLMFRDYGNNTLTNGRFYYQDDAWHFRGGGEGEADVTSDTAMYIRSGNIERLVLHDGNISSYAVPSSRTITINGTSYDLSANRSWTVTASETDTLATVVARGNVANYNIALGANAAISGGGSAKWITTDGTASYGGGLVSSVNGSAKAYYYFDGTNAVVQGASGVGIAFQPNNSTQATLNTSGDFTANSSLRAPIFYDSNDTAYYGDFNSTTRQYQAISFGDSSRYSAINTTINGAGAGDKLILYGGTSNYDARLLVGADYDMLFKSQGNSAGRGSFKFYSGLNSSLALTIDGTQGLRAGTSYNNSPAGTYFSHTLSGVGTNRVVNFDGNGTTPSVWWTNGARAYAAIDAKDPGMSFWANNGSSWQQQMEVNYGNVTINTDIRSPIFYDSNNTGYYVDPASTSNLNGLTVAGTISGNISGNAATATSAGSATNATNSDNAGHLRTAYAGGQQLNPQVYFNNTIGLKAAMTAAAGVWSDTLWINGYSGGDVLQMCAMHFQRNGTPRLYISNQASTATSYGTLYEILSNYGGTGTYSTTGDFRAPIFYDSNNTGYYVDPASTTRLNALTLSSLASDDGMIENNTGGYFHLGGWGVGRTAATAVLVNTAYRSDYADDAVVSNYSRMDYLMSDRDFPNGTLIQTSINYNNSEGDAFILEIKGNAYGNGMPMDIQIQGYIYANTIINTGGYSNGFQVSSISAIRYNGNLCFWFPSQGYWNGYTVKVYTAYSGRQVNKVTSISNSGLPTTDKIVNFTTAQSLRSDNYRGYSNFLTSVYGPSYYDSDDTAYYANFASTSDIAVKQRGGTVHGPNVTWGAYLLIGGDGRQNYTDSTVASVCTTNGNLHLDSGSGYSTHINFYDGNDIIFGNGASAEIGRVYNAGYLQMNSSLRAPIFYDANDTGYYVDPASSSNIRNITVSSLSNSTGLTVNHSGSTPSPAAKFNSGGGGNTYGAITATFDSCNYGTAIRVVTGLWSASQGAIQFYSNTTMVGNIQCSTTTTTYSTTSDYRLKENVVPMVSSIERLKDLNPCRFNFVNEPSRVVDGFIAHEVQAIIPEAVTGTKDEVDPAGTPVYQGIDQGKIVPLLTAALQDAITKIEELENRLSILENK